MSAQPFWKTVPLRRMNRAQWESLCDGCGKCCLHKLEDAHTGDVAYTNVACRLLDLATCRCADYANRKLLVPDCLKLTPQRVEQLDWMPASCAYRRLAHGMDLPDWHPLVTGDPDSVHRAGQSIRGRAVREQEAGDLEDHVLEQEP